MGNVEEDKVCRYEQVQREGAMSRRALKARKKRLEINSVFTNDLEKILEDYGGILVMIHTSECTTRWRLWRSMRGELVRIELQWSIQDVIRASVSIAVLKGSEQRQFISLTEVCRSNNIIYEYQRVICTWDWYSDSYLLGRMKDGVVSYKWWSVIIRIQILIIFKCCTNTSYG